MYKPYSIYLPPWDSTSGGIRVCYGLYGWLLTKGQIVYPNTILKDSIAIYPEIVRENPLGSNTIVRYVLQTAGVMAHYGVPGPSTEEIKETSDHIYVFSKIYDTFGVDDDHILFLPILNLHIFLDQGRERTKTCYLVGKGSNQHKHPEDSIELTREFAQDQQALANLLNECHTFYCYDFLSAAMEVARLCGCMVKYYGGMPKDQLEKYEPGLNGVTYCDDPTEKLIVDKFRSHYMNLVEKFSNKVDIFIEKTQT